MIREHLAPALVTPHPERDGAFRWRGDGVSRIEGLSDAVFGFAITLLVVSLGVPRTFDELARTIAGVPAFVAAFALLVMVWLAQYRFFRRYGLEDETTVRRPRQPGPRPGPQPSPRPGGGRRLTQPSSP